MLTLFELLELLKLPAAAELDMSSTDIIGAAKLVVDNEAEREIRVNENKGDKTKLIFFMIFSLALFTNSLLTQC